MKIRLIFVIASIISGAALAQSQIPNEFQAGQPARAAEVNENFDSLDQRVQLIEAPDSAQGQILTAIPLASEIRFLFAEYFNFRSSFPLDNNAVDAPLASSIRNDFISSVAISGNAIIATFGNNADPAIQNDTLEFIPNITGDEVYFTCNPTGGVVAFFSQDSCVLADDSPEPLTTIRKQVASAISLASEARWMVVDYYEHIGAWPPDNVAAGLEPATLILNAYVESVTVTGNVIAALYGNDAHSLIAGEIMYFTVSDNLGSRSWACTTPIIQDRYTGFLARGTACELPGDPPPNPAVVIRQQVQSGISLAASIQDLVEQFYQSNGFWPQSNAEAGAPVANTILNSFVTSVSIGIDGEIAITYGNNAHARLDSMMVALVPTNNIGSISWVCTSGNIQYSFVPYQCRNPN